MMSHIGVLGGMFDPIHNGHIEAAIYARDVLSLDLVKFIPCSIPNHKTEAVCSAQHRVAMVELASKDFPDLFVDRIEVDREGISYTVDTLRELSLQNSESKIVFILGMDAFNGLTHWYEWENLLTLCSFFVLARSSESVNEDIAAKIDLEKRISKSVESFLAQEVGAVYIAEEFNFDLSSTAVRSKLLHGADISNDVDQEVDSYIKEHNLYH